MLRDLRVLADELPVVPASVANSGGTGARHSRQSVQLQRASSVLLRSGSDDALSQSVQILRDPWDGNADVDLIVDGETWLDFKVRMQLQSERSAEATGMIVRELA